MKTLKLLGFRCALSALEEEAILKNCTSDSHIHLIEAQIIHRHHHGGHLYVNISVIGVTQTHNNSIYTNKCTFSPVLKSLSDLKDSSPFHEVYASKATHEAQLDQFGFHVLLACGNELIPVVLLQSCVAIYTVDELVEERWRLSADNKCGGYRRNRTTEEGRKLNRSGYRRKRTTEHRRSSAGEHDEEDGGVSRSWRRRRRLRFHGVGTTGIAFYIFGFRKEGINLCLAELVCVVSSFVRDPCSSPGNRDFQTKLQN
ncbi:hypothetical protein LXL04_015207 [Taraxacum kok-saghyz]